MDQELLDALTVYAVEATKESPIEIRDSLYTQQDAFVMDPSLFLDALCTRRAGKSTGLGIRFFRTMQKYPGCFCPYIALTRESARNIMWDILQELDQRFAIGAAFTESNLTCTFPNGSRLQLFGADMANFIRRLKGIKSPGIGVDEAQDFGGHLKSLIDDVLTPATADYKDGWIAVVGTPGPVPTGYFYEVSHQRKHGYSHHAWTLFDNPYLPNPRGFVDAVMKRQSWDETNPTYLREYKGQWVTDFDALVFKYDRLRNDFRSLPIVPGTWTYIIGVDVGYDDADAIAVIGWPEHSKEAYLIEELVEAKQGITELANQIDALIKRYDPLKIVMDTGGLGKKIAEEMQRRYELPIKAAEKDRKFEFIELLNDAMRTRRFYAKAESRFSDDAQRVKWDRDSVKPKIDDRFHSDICDAVLYAFRESLHWLATPAPVKLVIGTPEYFKNEEKVMEEWAEQQLTKDDVDIWGDVGWNVD